jgi:hypothetical protein
MQFGSLTIVAYARKVAKTVNSLFGIEGQQSLQSSSWTKKLERQ